VSAPPAGAIFRVTIEVDPAVEAEWSRWHADPHMREVVAQPGFLRATRWRDTEDAPDGWARYVSHYEAESVAAIEAYRRSEAATAIRADHERHYGKVTRLTRAVLATPVVVASER
jgi:hypothetical protein